jgi:uncharacterized membrane protein
MATNLDLQAQLNQLLADQNKLLEQSAKLAKDQASLTKDMVDTLRTANFKDIATDIQNASQAVSGASDATKNLGSTNQDVFDKMNTALREAIKREDESGKGIEDMTKKLKRFSVAAAAIDGFAQGLRFTANMLHTAKDAGVGLVETMSNLAASIISIPFKMLSGLIRPNMADAGGGDTGLRQALEDIRKEFGALHATSGKAIIAMARSMKGELAQTGLSTYRIFGNLAEKLKTMQEYAHNLGPLFAALAGQFVKNTEAIGAYYKGLGLTEDGQKAVATRAHALQTALTDELREMANYSLQLSKAFNGAAGSAKEISRDMGTLMADFKHFGGISTKEIGQAVVYFRRLGIEVAKVMGVIERYDNFEDAANGAAQLSQAFNLNVDALEMMKAQNPAERVEMLRKSFFAAGRSVENMTRQERALLAQQTGLDDSALDLAFSMKNQGMTYDEVRKKGDAAKKTQMTQVQAMKALADSIERLVKSGSFGKGGFIDRFIQGFTAGIQRSRDFRHLMRELRSDLRVAYWEGIKVGKAFVNMFPGVKDVFQGLADLFDRRKFRSMFKGATDIFREFFENMTEDPRTAMPKLLERLKEDFFSWFQGNSQNGQRILDGFKKFFTAIGEISGSLLKIAMKGLRDGVQYITDLITGRKRLDTSGAKADLGFLGRLLGPMIDAIKEVGPSLWNAVKTMFGEVWKKVEPWLKSHLLDIAGVLAGPALIGMVGKTIATSIAGMFTEGLLGFAKGDGVKKAINAVKDRFLGQVNTAVQAIGQTPRTPGGGGAGQAAAGAIHGAEEAAEAAAGSKVNWAQALVKMAAITLFIVVGMVGILYAIFRFAKAIQENRITPTSIATASLAMVTTATAMVAIAGAVKLLSAINLNPGMAGRILAGLVIVGLVGVGMAFAAKKMINVFGEIPLGKINKTVLVMASVGTFFLAAAAVTAIAAGIGLVASAGGGLGALAIAAGLAVLALTIEGMAVQGIRIMTAIDRFHPSPGFTEKAHVFVEIMKGIGSFVGSVSQLIAATRPGILDFLRGAGSEEQRNTLSAVNTTIASLSSQIIMIVETLRCSINSLQGSEAQLRAAQALGTLLGAVAELGNALKPPTEALQESGWYTTLTGGGEDISAKINATTQFMQTIAPQLRSFVRMIGDMFKGGGVFAQGITADQERAAQVVPGILRSVAEFMNSLRAGTSAILQVARDGNQASVLNSVSNYMSSLLKGISESSLFTKIGNLITTISMSVGSLNPSQAKAVEALAPVIGPAFTAISQIAGIVSSLSGGNMAPQTANAERIAQLTDFVSTFFSRIQTSFPQMIRDMNTVFSGMSGANIARFETGTKAINGILSSVTQLLSSSTLNPIEVQNKFNNLSASFAAMQTGMGRIADQLENSTSFQATITRVVENIQRVHFERVNTVVTEMVSKTNELATQIKGLEPINIETGLRKLGDSLGLGADGTYTIQNRNFNINVNFTVKFDNNGLDALELAMLRRVGPNNTRIQHGDLTQ